MTTVFPASTVIGEALDAVGGNQGWADNLASYAMYWGFRLGSHLSIGNIITQSCYIGIGITGSHGVNIGRYDVQSCMYGIYIGNYSFGNYYISFWNGEDYASPTEKNNQTIDLYVSSVVRNGGIAGIAIDNFDIEYNYGQRPNRKLLVIVDDQNSSSAKYPVVFKNINSYYSVPGTTAGSVYPVILEYITQGTSGWPGYRKMIYVFQGYENDTTTNQTIPCPSNNAPHNNTLGFSATPAIIPNTTGLTITASTSGPTITSPNSTTTYNDIVIVEEY